MWEGRHLENRLCRDSRWAFRASLRFLAAHHKLKPVWQGAPCGRLWAGAGQCLSLLKGAIPSRAQGLVWLLSSINHPLRPTASLTHPCPLRSASYSTEC